MKKIITPLIFLCSFNVFANHFEKKIIKLELEIASYQTYLGEYYQLYKKIEKSLEDIKQAKSDFSAKKVKYVKTDGILKEIKFDVDILSSPKSSTKAQVASEPVSFNEQGKRCTTEHVMLEPRRLCNNQKQNTCLVTETCTSSEVSYQIKKICQVGVGNLCKYDQCMEIIESESFPAKVFYRTPKTSTSSR